MSVCDSCVVWLNLEKNTPEQWGAEPWSTTRGVGQADKFLRYGQAARKGSGSYIVSLEESGNQVDVAIISLGERTPYVRQLEKEESWPDAIKETDEELYLVCLAVHRSFKGMKIGDAALQFAKDEGRKAGKRSLWTDAYRGVGKSKGGLVAWYESQGFRRAREFTSEGWTGMLLEADL